MSKSRDGHNSLASRGEVIARFAEAMLANMMAFERSGFSILSVRVSVDRHGGVIKRGSIVLDVPVEGHLSNREMDRAFDAFDGLYRRHVRRELSEEDLIRITREHDVESKAAFVRSKLGRR